MHLAWVGTFVTLIALSLTLTGKKKIIPLVLEWVIACICIVDYSCAYFRGIGLVKSDLIVPSSVFAMISKNGFIRGKKFWICILFLIVASAFALLKDKLVESKKIRLFLCTVVFGVSIILGIMVPYPNDVELFGGNGMCEVPYYDADDTWDTRDRAVLHALGVTADGITLTNSYNALEYNYARGARTFEADISFTSDMVPVLRHDWASDLGQADDFNWQESEKPVPTYDDFMKAPIYDKYTPMSLLDLFIFMKNHSDVYVVTDVKLDENVTVEKQYDIITKVALENDLEEVLHRLVIQIYYYDMYDKVINIYPFENILLTLYTLGNRPQDELRDYLISHKMISVTMPQWCATDEMCGYLAGENIRVYTHTINDANQVLQCFGQGVYGIYTDTFMPRELELMFKYVQND